MSAIIKALLRVLIASSLLGYMPTSLALSISDIQLNSSLNERLDATIAFTSVSPKEIENLKVGVLYNHSTSSFYRQPTITVDVVTRPNGKHFLHIQSTELIKEPVVNFILELSWSTGRLNRQYQLLIDPKLG